MGFHHFSKEREKEEERLKMEQPWCKTEWNMCSLEMEGGVHAFMEIYGSSEEDSPISSEKVLGCFLCSDILAGCKMVWLPQHLCDHLCALTWEILCVSPGNFSSLAISLPCHGICAVMISQHVLPQGMLTVCVERFSWWHAWAPLPSLSWLCVLPRTFPSFTSRFTVTGEWTAPVWPHGHTSLEHTALSQYLLQLIFPWASPLSGGTNPEFLY